MEKQQIVTILSTIKTDYKLALNTENLEFPDFEILLYRLSIVSGLCEAICNQKGLTKENFVSILMELDTDLMVTKSQIHNWYLTPLMVKQFSREVHMIKTLALKPRLNHLNRTITRLQTELQTSNN